MKLKQKHFYFLVFTHRKIKIQTVLEKKKVFVFIHLFLLRVLKKAQKDLMRGNERVLFRNPN